MQYMDTAGAVDHIIALKDPSAAALASRAAAQSRGARILQKNVEDRADNVTRFVVLSLDTATTSVQGALTSIFFETSDVPAALFKSLAGFATTGTNIIKLESFVPMTAHTEAGFYLEFEGHPDAPGPRVALTELGFYTRRLVILGTYPRSPFRKSLKKPKLDNQRYSRRNSTLR
jgi:prephenate dehydratase